MPYSAAGLAATPDGGSEAGNAGSDAISHGEQPPNGGGHGGRRGSRAGRHLNN